MIADVIYRALKERLKGCSASSIGLRSHALPTEDALDELVEASARLLAEHPGARVVIGSSKTPSTKPPAGVTILSPHAAAAEATRLRNLDASAGAPLLYFNTDSTPGESGLTVLEEVTAGEIAGAFARAGGLPILEELAGRRARIVRSRLADASVRTLGRYLELARPGAAAPSATDGLDVKTAEAAALPLLGLLAFARSKRTPPGATPAVEFDRLRGVKALNAVKEAKLELAESDDWDLKALAGVLLDGKDRPLKRVRDIAEAVVRLCAGEPLDYAELSGLSIELARALRGGPKGVRALLGARQTGDLTPEKNEDEIVEPKVAQRVSEPDLLTQYGAAALEDGALEVELEGDELVEATLDLGGELGVVAIRPYAPAGLVRALIRDLPREALARYVLRGGALWVPSPELLTARSARGAGKLELRTDRLEEASAQAPAEVRSALHALMGARRGLLDAVAGALVLEDELAPPEVFGDDGEDAQPEAPEGAPQEGADSRVPSNLAVVLATLDAHPLAAVAKAKAAAEDYVTAYEALLRATAGLALPQALGELLVNLDVALVTQASVVSHARLLPLHPLRISRMLTWLTTGVAPPAFPPRLLVHYAASELLLPSGDHDVYMREQATGPSDEGLAQTAREGLAGLWGLLRERRLLSAVAIELIDVRSPAAVIEALAELAQERFDSDAEVGAGVHIVVRPVFSREERRGEWIAPLLEELDQVAQDALGATPGEGVSIALKQPRLADGELSHLTIEAVHAPFVQLPKDYAGVTGLKLRYVPSGSGNVALIEIADHPTLTAYDGLLEQHEFRAVRRGLDPSVPAPIARNALVRAVVARGGWPIQPTGHEELLSYAETDDHVVAVLCQRALLRPRLERELRRLTSNPEGLDVAALQGALIGLYSCRGLFRALLEGAEKRHLRGQLGLARAFIAARDEPRRPVLALSLDAPEGLRWARAAAHWHKADSTRPDLILIEAEDDTLSSIRRLRVIELKARESPGAYGSEAARGKLSAQARVAAARLAGTFVEDGPEMRAALQRLAWLEAGRQRAAKRWERVLHALEAALQAASAPPVEVECWIVPETPWHGEQSFREAHPGLDAGGGEVEGGEQEVRFVFLQPLPAGEEEGSGERRPAESPPTPAPKEPEPRAERVAEARAEYVAAVAPVVTQGEPPEVPSEPAAPRGMTITLGHVAQTGEPAVWTPNHTDVVNHFNVGITGTMGTGKTQLTKSLLAQLIHNGGDNVGGARPGILIFDYKGDYRDTALEPFATAIGARVLDPSNLPLNPLRPLRPRERRDLVLCQQAFADTLMAIDPRMGLVQRNEVIRRIGECYAAAGISPQHPATWSRPFPTLRDISPLLAESKKASGIPEAIVSDLVELGVFSDEDPVEEIDELFDGVNVIDLQPLGGTPSVIRAILCFFMNAFYSAMLQRGEAPLTTAPDGRQLRALRRLVLVDEADDFIALGLNSLKNVMQQGRSFGCGVILSTQFLHHFERGETPLRPLVGTWVLHQMAEVTPSDLQKLFGLGRDDAGERARQLGRLEKHTALCRGLSNPGYRDRLVHMRDLPFKDLRL